MSFVFKQIDAAYKTSTPFYAHKRWTISSTNVADLTNNPPDTVGGDISMSIYYGKYTQSLWIGTSSEERTTLGEFTRNIWNSAYHLYIKEFQNKPYEYYKQGHIGVETRNVSDVIQVFSIPQKIIGIGIKPGSFRLVAGGYTFIDDGNGNVLGSNNAALQVYNTSSQDLYFCSYMFNEAYKYIDKRSSFTLKSHGNLGATVPWNLNSGSGIAAPVHGPAYIQAQAINVKGGKSNSGGSLFHIDFTYDANTTGSSYIRIPHSDKLNFDTKEELSISFWINNSNATSGPVNLISKRGRRRILRNQINPYGGAPTSELNTYVSDEVVDGPYPFAIEINGGSITFSISDGSGVSSVTGAVPGGWGMVTCTKDSASLKIYTNGGAATTAPCGCHGSTRNDADVFIGVRGNLITGSVAMAGGNIPANGTTQFNGKIGPVHIFNKTLTATDVSNLYAGNYDNHYGTIQYDHGQIVWTNTHGTNGSNFAQSTACQFNSMQFRSTKLITTNEFICAAAPGELNMTTNPSILLKSTGYCNPANNSEGTSFPNEGGECYSFVTSSDFSPYVTGIGLYNDQGDLLVYGKLATPIKKATNCDTIFIVKWDES